MPTVIEQLEEKKAATKKSLLCKIGFHNYVICPSFHVEEDETKREMWVLMVCVKCFDYMKAGLAHSEIKKVNTSGE